MTEFKLEYHLRFNILGLKLLGLWPKTEGYLSTPLYLLHAIVINFFLVYLFTFSVMIYIYLSTHDIASFTENGYVVLPCLMATVKAYFLVTKSSKLKELVKGMKRNIELSDELNNSMVKYFKTWHILFWYYGVFNICAVGTLEGIYPLFDPRKKGAKPLPFAAWYPYDANEQSWYYFTYFHQISGICLDAFVNAQTDTILTGLLAYIAAECNVLSELLRNFKKYSKHDDNNDFLIEIIKYHKNILEYATEVQIYIDSYMIFQFGTSSLTLAMNLFNMTQIPFGTIQFMESIGYQTSAALEIMVYCWFGNEVYYTSKILPDSAFQGNWEDESLPFKKNLAFFIRCSQKPIRIVAKGLIELSLDTYKAILKSAYSYFTLLQQVAIKNK